MVLLAFINTLLRNLVRLYYYLSSILKISSNKAEDLINKGTDSISDDFSLNIKAKNLSKCKFNKKSNKSYFVNTNEKFAKSKNRLSKT